MIQTISEAEKERLRAQAECAVGNKKTSACDCNFGRTVCFHGTMCLRELTFLKKSVHHAFGEKQICNLTHRLHLGCGGRHSVGVIHLEVVSQRGTGVKDYADCAGSALTTDLFKEQHI